MENKLSTETVLDISDIKERIYIIRGKKVMLDRDLAMLYGVKTMRLNEAVKRNTDRFPDDFMFRLNKEEVDMLSRSQFAILNTDSPLRSQFAILKKGKNIKYAPLAFTEQGIAMLSGVLNSKRAILVNIQIIRIFTKLREMIDAYKELREKVEEMEKNNETNFREIFRAIRLLIQEKEKPRREMGFGRN